MAHHQRGPSELDLKDSAKDLETHGEFHPVPTNVTVKNADEIANPAPLGLFGFGITTVLLNLHNADLYDLNAMIMAMGLACGGLL